MGTAYGTIGEEKQTAAGQRNPRDECCSTRDTTLCIFLTTLFIRPCLFTTRLKYRDATDRMSVVVQLTQTHISCFHQTLSYMVAGWLNKLPNRCMYIFFEHFPWKPCCRLLGSYEVGRLTSIPTNRCILLLYMSITQIYTSILSTFSMKIMLHSPGQLRDRQAAD